MTRQCPSSSLGAGREPLARPVRPRGQPHAGLESQVSSDGEGDISGEAKRRGWRPLVRELWFSECLPIGAAPAELSGVLNEGAAAPLRSWDPPGRHMDASTTHPAGQVCHRHGTGEKAEPRA